MTVAVGDQRRRLQQGQSWTSRWNRLSGRWEETTP
jgi:hypothetical protein